MSDNKAGQPNRAAPPVTLRNAKTNIHQRPDSNRSQQHVNEIQEHLIFRDSCPETKKAIKAVCTQQTYQGTLLMLIYLAGCIDQDTAETYIGADTLAKRMGINRDTAGEQLKRLQDSGIVTLLGKHGRSDIRSVMLPCNHLDIVAGSSGDTYAGSSGVTYADTHSDIYADTYPHYQDRKRTEQDQQQRDPVAGHSQAEKEKFHLKINSDLPQDKRVGFTKQFQQLIDLTADPVQVGVIIRQLHIEQNSWKGAGGTIDALKRITDTKAAKWREQQPKPVLNPCAELADDVECNTIHHTTIDNPDAPVQVQSCPQRKVAS